MGRRRVHEDPKGWLLQSKLQDHVLILRMNGHRMTHAAVTQDLNAPFTSLAPVLDDIEREDRAELLDGKRVVTSDAVQRRDQRTCSCRDGDPGLFRDVVSSLPDKCRVG